MTSPGRRGQRLLCDSAVTSPEEKGRIDLCDFAVKNSSNTRDMSEVNRPWKGKEGRNGIRPQAENFLCGEAAHNSIEDSQRTPSDKSDQLHPPDKSAAASKNSNGVEFSQQTPPDRSDQLYPPDKSAATSKNSKDKTMVIEPTEADKIGKNSDATSPDKSTTLRPGKVELIPRPVRNRQRPAKYNDYETKFVRLIRRPRDKSDESTSPSAGPKRKVSFATNRRTASKSKEMTELEAENLTLSKRILRRNFEGDRILRQKFEADRILRQKRIEINQSEGEKTDQSEGENNAANNAESAGSENRDNNAVKEGIKLINNRGKEKTRARKELAGKKTRAQTQNSASEFLPADKNKSTTDQKCRPLGDRSRDPRRRASTESARRTREKYKREKFSQLSVSD